jgi:lipoate---protein ligase
MNLIELKNCFIKDQLHLEETLLRTSQENFCLINTQSAPAIVMGISGKEEILVHTQKNPFPVLRRFSGGGTVIVDENTIFITFISNKSFFSKIPYPESILRWALAILSPATPKLQLQENDFTIGEKKCGGNALYITKNRFLLHTSFLWDFDPKKMEILKHPPKTPNYRQNRTHEEFLCRLQEHITDQHNWISQIKKIVSTNDSFDLGH